MTAAAATRSRDQGKSMFIKEMLNDDPTATHRAVEAAWRRAGMSGTISPTLVSRVRSRLGLTPRSRGGRPAGSKTKATGARRGRPPRDAGTPAAPSTDRARQGRLMELEVEIDRVLMKVAAIGTLPQVEESLRKTRRQLFAGRAS